MTLNMKNLPCLTQNYKTLKTVKQFNLKVLIRRRKLNWETNF